MSLLLPLLGLAGFCLVMLDVFQRLPDDQSPLLRRWFRNWTFKGFVLPWVLWIVFNSAAWDWLPPLMPSVEFAKANGHWFDTMEYIAQLGLFVIGTYWAAVTTVWMLAVLARQAEDAQLVRRSLLIWTLFLIPLPALIIGIYGWRFAGLGMALWLLPVLQQVVAMQPGCDSSRSFIDTVMELFFNEQPPPKPPPLYSGALAAIHFDKFEKAEQAVIKELESCEDDFDGWMLMADLYANHFHDLPGAQKIIQDTCQHPDITPSQFAVACHRLADWHLKLAQDPDAARGALTAICRRYPGSHLDRMARLRIDQLPANREQYVAQTGVKTIKLRALSSTSLPKMSAPDATNRSQECIERLQTNPDDIATREELARLWGEEMGQVAMGVEQLQLLLEMPHMTPDKRAEWLGLMASWHLKFPQNLDAARAAMEQLLRQYPKSTQALAAQRRLSLMDLETKMRQTSDSRQSHSG